MKTNPTLTLALAVLMYVVLFAAAATLLPSVTPTIAVATLLPAVLSTKALSWLLHKAGSTETRTDVRDDVDTQAAQDWYLAESHLYVDGQPFSGGTCR